MIVFHRALLSARLEDVEAFYRGLGRAVERLNSSPREELLDTGWDVAVELFFPGLAPENLEPEARARVEEALGGIHIPLFPEPSPVPRETFAEVSAWAQGKGYLAGVVNYDRVMASVGP